MLGGEKSKISGKIQNFRKVVKWSEMEGNVVLGCFVDVRIMRDAKTPFRVPRRPSGVANDLL